MKDAKVHGSNPRGGYAAATAAMSNVAHQTGVQQVGRTPEDYIRAGGKIPTESHVVRFGLLKFGLQTTDSLFPGEPGNGPVHVGTALAAKTALEARIGIPADGKGWNGDREYGKTLLAGSDTLKKLSAQGYPNNKGFLETGMNAGAPKEDYYITDQPNRLKYATMGGGNTPIPLDAKPAVHAYQVTGALRPRVLTDEGANRLASKGKLGGMGAKYTNIGEDSGSISVVVPDKTFLRKAS